MFSVCHIRYNPYTTCCNGNCCGTGLGVCLSCVPGLGCVKCGGDSNKRCCSGQCYDIRTQQCCYDRSGIGHICEGNFEQKTCCGDGSCIPAGQECCNGSGCDPAKCETCVNGACEACGGDPTKKCCGDGSCAKPCELAVNEYMCAGETELCPYRCDVSCDSYYKINYTGNSINACREPGCPGDCQDDVRPICYTKTMCGPWALNKMSCYGSMCLAAPGGGGVCFVCMHGQYPVENIPAPYNEKCSH